MGFHVGGKLYQPAKCLTDPAALKGPTIVATGGAEAGQSPALRAKPVERWFPDAAPVGAEEIAPRAKCFGVSSAPSGAGPRERRFHGFRFAHPWLQSISPSGALSTCEHRWECSCDERCSDQRLR